MKQLSLGELIDALEAIEDKSRDVYFDFPCAVPTKIDSSRGSYDQPALGFALEGYGGNGGDAPTVSDLITELKHGLHAPYEGWKGGTYHFNRSSRLWVDNPGNWSSTAITAVADDGWCITLETERERD